VFLADRGDGSRLTVSTGVATLPTVAHSADGLLHAADAAMYRVKEAGRDGVHVAAPGSVAPALNAATDDDGEEGESR
jgi:PleD family two-component response regulator